MKIPHERADNDIAERLIDELKLMFIGSARYHYAGDFYNLPNAYPFVLFDSYGYIIINSERELVCKLEVKKRVHIPKGICRLSTYIKYPFIPKCLKNEHEIRRLEDEKLRKAHEPFQKLMGFYVEQAGASSLQKVYQRQV